MSVTISWAKKVQLAKCDISVGFPKFSHIYFTETSFVYWYLYDSALPEVTVVKESFIRLVAGQRVTLTCIATGPQLLWIRWSKDRDRDHGAAVIGDYARTGMHIKCGVYILLSVISK